MVIFGGIRTVARVTEWMALIMATIYVIMVAIICLEYISQSAPLGQIFLRLHRRLHCGVAWAVGIIAAMINGPSAASSPTRPARVPPPTRRRPRPCSTPCARVFIQPLGVFIDTIVVCTATAFVILLAGPEVGVARR